MAVALGGVDHVANDQIGDADDGEVDGDAGGEIEEVGLRVLHAPFARQGSQLFFVGVTHGAVENPDDGGERQEAEEENGGGEGEHLKNGSIVESHRHAYMAPKD